MNELRHPAFWWIWAALISTALIQQNSLAVTLAVIVVIALIATLNEVPAHRRKIFAIALRIALAALSIRILFAILIGVPLPGRVLFNLPEIALPDFLVGIRLGGPVTLERLSSAFSQGLLFATLIALFGLANSLSTPAQLIKVLPNRLYGLGVATTLATTITPSIANSVARIRTAQYLRGQSDHGIRSWGRLGTPVLEEALSRSIDIAAAMEARGYGISRTPTRYRAQPWRAAEVLSVISASYLVLFFPFLNLDSSLETAIFATMALIPAAHR